MPALLYQTQRRGLLFLLLFYCQRRLTPTRKPAWWQVKPGLRLPTADWSSILAAWARPPSEHLRMRKPRTVRSAETFGRVRLSQSFFMRDFLYSEIANLHGLAEPARRPRPGDRRRPEAVRASARTAAGDVRAAGDPVGLSRPGGQRLRQRAFPELRLERTQSRAPYLGSAQRGWRHRRDGQLGRALAGRPPRSGATWQAMAWWIHDHLPYSELQFFPKLAAFNIGWHEKPRRRISSFVPRAGCSPSPAWPTMTATTATTTRRFPELALPAEA